MAKALPTNLLSAYDIGFFGASNAASAILNREDLTDVITILDSFQTPGFSGFSKIRARDVVHSWPLDSLAAPVTGSTPEGLSFEGDSPTNPVRLFNGTHIFRKDVIVSDRERVATVAGISDLYDHQIMKRMREIARDCEYTMFRIGSTASATGAESAALASGPVMAGFRGAFGGPTIIVTGASALGTGVGAGFATGDLLDAVQTMYVRGAEPDSVWFAPSTKRQFIDATQGSAINVRGIAATDQRLVQNIEVFETAFGQLLAIITDRFIPMTTATAGGVGAWFVGDRKMAKLAFYRPPQHKEMGKDGDHTRGLVLMELTLQVDHPSSWLAVTGVSGATGLVSG